MGKSRHRLTKVAPTATCDQRRRWNKDSLVVHLLNMGGGMMLRASPPVGANGHANGGLAGAKLSGRSRDPASPPP